MPKQRLAYFDVAKAVAMAAVITGHLLMRYDGTPEAVSVGASEAIRVCFSFHLPLFFIVSGYFMHTDRPFDWRKEARALLLPYLATCVVLVVGVTVDYLLVGGADVAAQAFFAMLSAAAFGAGSTVSNPLWPQLFFVGAIWYLLALFWARLAASLCFKAGRWAAIPAAACFAVALWSVGIVYLPLSVQAGLAAVPYVVFGAWLRRVGALDALSRRPLALVPLALAWFWAIACQDSFGMATVEYGSTPMEVARNLLGGAAGALVVLCALKLFEQKAQPGGRIWRGLAAMGANTLAILCVHIVEEDGVPWSTLFSLLWDHAPVLLFWPVFAFLVVAVDAAVAFGVRALWRRAFSPKPAR